MKCIHKLKPVGYGLTLGSKECEADTVQTVMEPPELNLMAKTYHDLHGSTEKVRESILLKTHEARSISKRHCS